MARVEKIRLDLRNKENLGGKLGFVDYFEGHFLLFELAFGDFYAVDAALRNLDQRRGTECELQRARAD